MTTYSVFRSKLSGTSSIRSGTSLSLALGAAGGGVFGKWAFGYIQSQSREPDMIGAIQAACLMLITLMILLYTLKKERIPKKQVTGKGLSVLIGLGLGIFSSFLGIGGGPINLAVLYYFYSMDTKTAAENSLFIIFFSQLTSLFYSLMRKTASDVDPVMLIVMITGGILGGIFGRKWNKKLEESTVTRLFIGLMVVIILINIYNIFLYTR